MVGLMAKNVNPHEPNVRNAPDGAAIPDAPDGAANPPDAPVKTDPVLACLLVFIVMATILMLSLIISDCLLGVDLPQVMQTTMLTAGSYSHQVIQSTSEELASRVLSASKLLADTILGFWTVLWSEETGTSIKELFSPMHNIISSVASGLKGVLETICYHYIPTVSSTLGILISSFQEIIKDCWPHAKDFISHQQDTLGKLLEKLQSASKSAPQHFQKSSRLESVDTFDLVVLSVTIFVAPILVWMVVTRMLIVVRIAWRVLTFVGSVLPAAWLLSRIRCLLGYVLNLGRRLIIGLMQLCRFLFDILIWVTLLGVCIMAFYLFL